MIKILIVDDHPMMREALKTTFLTEKDLTVIGEAGSGEEALLMLETLAPDLILMDILLPRMDGVETTVQIKKRFSTAKILMLTSLEDEIRVLSAVQAGALGYFPKTASRDYLLEAIRKVADGIPYMPNGITLKLFQALQKNKLVQVNDDSQITLTARQLEVLTLMAEGHSDNYISQVLHLEESTVRAHIHQLIQRLGLENRTQAVAYAHQRFKQK